MPAVKKHNEPRIPPKTRDENLRNKSLFRDFIIGKNHPCIMAQSVFTQDNVDFHTYKNLGSRKTAKALIADLKTYLGNCDPGSKDFFTFIAAFDKEQDFSEKEFEIKLWKQLQFLHEEDDLPWNPEVSENPVDDNFSFSLTGQAFYIVGMHPNSSRSARQSPFPALVFNLHNQFESLRDMGVYGKVQERIRKRDVELQGSVNPMLKDFGEESEARQYSGRKVGKEWKCPFHQ